MILPFIATDRIDLGHPGYRAQLRPHHPVRKGTQVGWRPFAPVRLPRSRLGLDGEHEDLAEPCRDRPHLGLDAFGKLAFHLLITCRSVEVRVGQECVRTSRTVW